MVKDEAKKLEALARAIHLYCDDGKYYDRGEWQDIVVDAELGIDRRTSDSYFRLAKIRRLIHEQSMWRWCKGKEFGRFLPKSENEETPPDAKEVERVQEGGRDAG